jgi:hypothetical protein
MVTTVTPAGTDDYLTTTGLGGNEVFGGIGRVATTLYGTTAGGLGVLTGLGGATTTGDGVLTGATATGDGVLTGLGATTTGDGALTGLGDGALTGLGATTTGDGALTGVGDGALTGDGVLTPEAYEAEVVTPLFWVLTTVYPLTTVAVVVVVAV